MRRTFLLKSLLLLCALVAGSSSVWGADITGTINFGSASGSTAINSTSVNGNDSQGNEWTITTVMTQTSFTQNASYSQVGAASKPATSITFTTTLDKSQTIKAFSAKFGGFNGTAGTVTLKVGEETVGSGSLNGTSDVTVEATDKTQSDTELTVTVTGISKGVKCYYISYTYEDNTPSSSATFTEKTPSINFPAIKTYSQAPTTAAGYSGTITYSITANTAGATINASTGLVTVTGGGSVTVKATAPATTGFAGSEDTYTLTVNDTRADAGLAWSAESANVTYGADNNVFPTLTNTHNVPVTFTSSNQAAATIDGNGAITLMDKTATTQIKAIFDGNDDYLPQTVAYTLNVTKAPFAIKDGVFDFVEAADANEDYGSGISTTDDGQYYEADDATWTAGNVTMVTSGKYRWWYNGNDLRFYTKKVSNAETTKITLTAPENHVITKVVFDGGSDFSPSIGSLTSGTWSGAANSITFTYDKSSGSINVNKITVTYKSTSTTTPITIACEGGYASYSCNTPLDFTNSGAEAYIIKSTSENSASLTQVTKVPANTGIIVKGTKDVVVNVSIANGELDDVTGNLLKGTVNTPKAVALNEAYGLSKTDGKFHLLNAGTIPANKAYLLASEVFQAGAAAVLDLDFGETTGVNTLNVERGTLNGECYNLNGQRVAQPTKGLYIVNGRKVVIK